MKTETLIAVGALGVAIYALTTDKGKEKVIEIMGGGGEGINIQLPSIDLGGGAGGSSSGDIISAIKEAFGSLPTMPETIPTDMFDIKGWLNTANENFTKMLETYKTQVNEENAGKITALEAEIQKLLAGAGGASGDAGNSEGTSLTDFLFGGKDVKGGTYTMPQISNPQAEGLWKWINDTIYENIDFWFNNVPKLFGAGAASFRYGWDIANYKIHEPATDMKLGTTPTIVIDAVTGAQSEAPSRYSSKDRANLTTTYYRKAAEIARKNPKQRISL